MARPQTFKIDGFQKQRFLEWLCTPPKERDPKTMHELADEIGVSRRQMTEWKTNDKEFMEAWEKKYLQTIGDPSRKQTLMDTLFATGSDRDDPKHVQAIKTYMEIEGSLKPAHTQITVQGGDASKLTMEQLDELLAQKAASEKDRRLRAVGDGD